MRKKEAKMKLERLVKSMEASAEIGALPGGGIRRLALTDEDKQMRDILIDWMEKIDLQVRVDDFGNIYGRREGKNKNAAAVLIGSHLDTQPEGGKYDGILGVLGGLEVLTVLHEQQMEHEHPIELVCFTNEEGARFEPPILGAGGLSGYFSKDYVYSRTDKDGKVFLEELQRIGYQGKEENRPSKLECYLELHIEQGPVLEFHQEDIGVVTGIQGMNWLEVTVHGQADHAGPTPMAMRKDALLAAVEMIQMMTDTVKGQNEEATITIGRMQVQPNSINSIPGQVTFSVDIRHADDAVKNTITDLVMADIHQGAEKADVSANIHKIWEAEAVHFSTYLIDAINQNKKNLKLSGREIISGAGHDAKYMNEITPTAMIFVPSKDGKSHCKEEFTSPKEMEDGVNLLLHTVMDIAKVR